MSEHTEQAALFEFAAWAATRLPELDLLYAVPNGGKRDKATAAKLKAEGVKAGVPDVFLPVARHGTHGLYIEMKLPSNKPTAEQREWMRRLIEQGYTCHVSYSWQEAARLLVRWLGAEVKDFGL